MIPSPKILELATIYASRRGIPADQMVRFLDSNPQPPNCIDELPDTTKAIWLITKAVAADDRIVLFGDYDADGVTSTTIFTEFLQQTTGKRPIWHVPNRQTDLYGLSYETAHPLNPQLLIALDCGTHSREAVLQLKQDGAAVIIIDHHPAHFTDAAPADALLNPNLGQPHPNLAPLCTAGLAYLFCQALATTWGCHSKWNNETAIMLAAIGTLGDACFLNPINRAIVRRGITQLNNPDHLNSIPGLASLLATKNEPVTRRRILYDIVPKINALGRIEDARMAVELLLEQDPEKAETKAAHCNQINTKRQELQQTTFDQALPMAEAILARNPSQKLLVLADSRWHHGIVGITASQIREQTNRAAILLAPYEGTRWKGSGRAMPNEDLGKLAELLRTEERVLNAGGHAGAIGLLVDGPQLKPLQNWATTTQVPPGSNNEPPYEVLGDPNALSPQNWRELLCCLEPFGRGNPMVAIQAKGWQLSQNPDPVKNAEGKVWAVKGLFKDQTGHSINVTWKDLPAAQQIWTKGHHYTLEMELTWRPYRGTTYYNWNVLNCKLAQ